MKEKRDCKIVQDLLPNYIEKLTNEETNKYIEEHLKECTDCSKMLQNMQKDVKFDNSKRDGREVKYIKKFSNKMKALKFILLTIIIVYLVVVGRRIIILTSLSKKAKENLLNNNYYAKLYSYQGDRYTMLESYNKEDDYFTTMTIFTDGKQIQKISKYKKGNDQLAFTEVDGKKYMQNAEEMLFGPILPITNVSDSFLSNMLYAFFIGTDKTYCNGKECYVLKGYNYERYIDKNTGLAVRSIEKFTKEVVRKTDIIVDYEYEFNIVKDSDIMKPNIDFLR